jgi:signal transduction histidine kinase
MTRPRPSILIVDDSHDKLVALESILLDLDVELVQVRSGREALRRLLMQDFAVVLLDVRMPGMDGFETAALMRQRPRSEHTPVIFITAFPDETHVARGYSLRAVDYIMTPIVPDVLRTKVSVFVELARATTEVRWQAERLRERAEQLHRLAAAALAINSAQSIDAMLTVVTENARAILGAAGAVTVGQLDDRRTHRVASGAEPSADDDRLAATVAATKRPARRDQVLAVPLAGHEGRSMGHLEVFGRPGSDFTEEDQALLVQLAQMAAIALENTLFSEAREANRLKDEFLATVSHELRTPLSAMRTWSWMLRRGGLKPEVATRALESIDRNITAQTRIVEDLLDVSRIVTGKLRLRSRPLDLLTVVEAGLEAILPDAETKGVAVVRALDAAPAPLVGDPERLQQVIWNLLSNAVKFTPKGGRIEVQVALTDGEVQLRVSDTGRGIPPAFLPHVFERFRQADGSSTRSAGGLGLGLAIVRHLVELHGGRVEAASDGDGAGAAFTVTLPLARDAQVATGASVAAADRAPNLDGIRVLIVEDDDDTREGIALVLSEAGARVSAVGSASEALAALDASPADVMLCDIGLPGEDGYNLIRQVRALETTTGRSMPAAALTAYAQTRDRDRALEAGFQNHLAKPVNPPELLREVARLAATGHPRRSLVSATASVSAAARPA